MDGYHRTNSAPAGPSHAALRLEPYERTYSACGPLDLQWSSGESTLNDYAIARALEEERGPPAEDTSMDHALAVALYNEQVDEICELQHYEEMRTAAANPAAPLTCSSNLVAGGQEPEIWEDGGASTSLLGRLKNWSILQLIPRLNCGAAPSPQHVSKDRERLLLRLDFYGLREHQVQGDGACQFRSLSDQLFHTEAHHGRVRARVVAQLQQHSELYKDYVTTEYAAYCRSMAQASTWGDHVTLKAAADAYGIRICLVTSFQQECIIAIDPQQLSAAGHSRYLWLSFWAEVHYNSLYPK